MGLLPIEFKDAFSDSPYFRSNIQAHERELEQTSSEIKTLIREIKELVSAARGKVAILFARSDRSLVGFQASNATDCSIGESLTQPLVCQSLLLIVSNFPLFLRLFSLSFRPNSLI